VNPSCADRGQPGRGNLSVRVGKGRGRWRVLRCSTCKKEFSERKGTPLWGTRMPPDKAAAIAKHLAEGCGIRKTARLVGASKTGVTSIALRLGLHARALHDDRVRDVSVTEAQFDEKWSFVGKKQKNCAPSNPEDDAKGDQWDITAVDVDSRMVVSPAVGKRDQEALKELVADFAGRTGGAPPP
jgi:transposase-like protein